VQLKEEGPPVIRAAARRIELALKEDRSPDSEDLAMAMIWLLVKEDRRQRQRQRRRRDREAAKQSVGWSDGGAQAAISAPPPSPSPRRPETTAFAQSIEEQEEDGATRSVRMRFGYPRSKVQSDGSGRRVVIQGDGQD
jgi:hypothetical protein